MIFDSDIYYTVAQESSGRFLDAYENGNHSAVTRTTQIATPQWQTQQWRFNRVGAVYTIEQSSTGLLLDAYVDSNDHRVVMREPQGNTTQEWLALDSDETQNPLTSRFQQLRSLRFLDAYQSSGNYFHAVTRGRQSNDTQQWRRLGARFQQGSSSRYLDSAATVFDNSSVVTDATGNEDSQQFVVHTVALAYTIRQRSSNRYLDAYEVEELENGTDVDYRAVTRGDQNNATQWWVARNAGASLVTLQQASSRRLLDAYEVAEDSDGNSLDYRAVTRGDQGNDTQRWRVEGVQLPS